MPLKVLVIDDSAYHRRTLTRIIAAAPEFEVVGTATDGEDAIKKVVTLQPDLLTLDLEMPRMDGFTFLRWLMRTFPRPAPRGGGAGAGAGGTSGPQEGCRSGRDGPVSLRGDRGLHRWAAGARSYLEKLVCQRSCWLLDCAAHA